MMCDADSDIREYCSCDGAKKYQTRLKMYATRSAQLEKLCGKDCDKDDNTPPEIRAAFKPVGDETYEVLDNILYSVIFKRIGKTCIKLADGTTLTISESGIERKTNIKNKLE